jgi:hypothetical protein
MFLRLSPIHQEAQMIQQLIPTSSHTVTVAEFIDDKGNVIHKHKVEMWALVGIGEGQRVTGMVVDHEAKGLLTIEQMEQKYEMTFSYFDERMPEAEIEGPVHIEGRVYTGPEF